MLYPCLGVDDAIFYISKGWSWRAGNDEYGFSVSGFKMWTVWCIFDHKYKNKSKIAA